MAITPPKMWEEASKGSIIKKRGMKPSPKASKGSTLSQNNPTLIIQWPKRGDVTLLRGSTSSRSHPNLLKSGASHLKIMVVRPVKNLGHLTSANVESNLGLANPSNALATINDDLAPV
jgi:hypothetical protein